MESYRCARFAFPLTPLSNPLEKIAERKNRITQTCKTLKIILRGRVRRRVVNARRRTNHPAARTHLSGETPVFGWISRLGFRKEGDLGAPEYPSRHVFFRFLAPAPAQARRQASRKLIQVTRP